VKIELPLFLTLLIAFGATRYAAAQGTAFTYQGQLLNNGTPVNSSIYLNFALYADSSGGSPVSGGGPIAPVGGAKVTPKNDLFTATLDFGSSPNPFTGSLYLEIQQSASGNSGTYTPLSPRVQLTPTPYAIYAENAGSVAAGSVTGSEIASSTIAAGNIANGQVVKSLNGLNDAVTLAAGANVTLTTNGNTLTMASAGGGNDWSLVGNAGTTPGVNFLGTTDIQPLELWVNSQRALRLEPNSRGAPNVIGGASVNFVAPGVAGAVIGGGGADSYVSGYPYTNSVAADFGTVSGGESNEIDDGAPDSTIGGGEGNQIPSFATGSTIGGGANNYAGGMGSVIGGGGINGGFLEGNTTLGNATVIGGGLGNRNERGADYSTIGGGWANLIQSGASSATIGGGQGNEIQAAELGFFFFESTYATNLSGYCPNPNGQNSTRGPGGGLTPGGGQGSNPDAPWASSGGGGPPGPGAPGSPGGRGGTRGGGTGGSSWGTGGGINGVNTSGGNTGSPTGSTLQTGNPNQGPASSSSDANGSGIGNGGPNAPTSPAPDKPSQGSSPQGSSSQGSSGCSTSTTPNSTTTVCWSIPPKGSNMPGDDDSSGGYISARQLGLMSATHGGCFGEGPSSGYISARQLGLMSATHGGCFGEGSSSGYVSASQLSLNNAIHGGCFGDSPSIGYISPQQLANILNRPRQSAGASSTRGF